MINRKRTFRTILALLLLAGLIAMSRTTQLDSTTNAIQPPSDLTVANLLVAVNGERTKAGTHPLVIDPLLNQSAQMKADEIEATGVFSHVNAEGKQGYEYIVDVGADRDCVYISESIVAPTSTRQAIDDWLGSKIHRDAMLEPRYDTTGFGISEGPWYDYVVQHFCDLP